MKQNATLLLKFNNSLKKAGAMNATKINLKCNEIVTKRLPKNLRDFANKRQLQHTSNLSKPSTPSHTLLKLDDAEDTAIDKIRTHDLALEINNPYKYISV